MKISFIQLLATVLYLAKADAGFLWRPAAANDGCGATVVHEFEYIQDGSRKNLPCTWYVNAPVNNGVVQNPWVTTLATLLPNNTPTNCIKTVTATGCGTGTGSGSGSGTGSGEGSGSGSG